MSTGISDDHNQQAKSNIICMLFSLPIYSDAVAAAQSLIYNLRFDFNTVMDTHMRVQAALPLLQQQINSTSQNATQVGLLHRCILYA